jgi:adenosylcobinamide-phosphate synthase
VTLFPLALTAFAQPAIAALFDRLVGYPNWLYDLIGHPVTWIGKLITYLDDKMNTTPHVKGLSRMNGVLALVLLCAAVWFVAALVHLLCMSLPFGIVLNGICASTLIAQKSLRNHVRAVEQGLSKSLAEGRRTVGLIVGRDTRNLDVSGVSKAALESLAENTSDGIVAPLFWYCWLGLPGLAVYKAINTADSMIGHKTAQYRYFGWATARLDDLVNLPAARLTALLFIFAAMFKGKTAVLNSIKAVWRDSGKHNSPNAGWPEAAMAGALGLTFGGPRAYDGHTLELPTMGNGRDHLIRQDIESGIRLFDIAMAIMVGALMLMAVFL